MKKIALLLFLPFIACSGNQTTQEEESDDTTGQSSVTDEDETYHEEINDNLPEGWHKAGDMPAKYEMGLDESVSNSGEGSAYIESKSNRITGFGTMMQTCMATEYIGERIKLTGHIKSENVDNWAGMWLRIDPEKGYDDLGFDNMQDRSIDGTMDWTKCEIVLDVPEESWTLNYGVLLSGTGKVWFDDFSFEIVDKNTPTTEYSHVKSKTILDEPLNINFEN